MEKSDVYLSFPHTKDQTEDILSLKNVLQGKNSLSFRQKRAYRQSFQFTPASKASLR